jgi:hypothetical protein
MQLVFRANNILEAHIVAGMLKSHDIDCHVGGHYLQGAVGDLPAADFAHVFVHEDDQARAEALIKDYENGEL